MSILEKLKNLGYKEAQEDGLCIQQIRLGQFIEDAKKLLALFDDGREKALGEYIFDRHYVVTLIERVVEGLGMMVYDASVLVPEYGEEFYRVYDRQTLTAKTLLDPSLLAAGSSLRGSLSLENSDAAEPEYQLLFLALEWFNGEADMQNVFFASTVIVFMEQLFAKVRQHIKAIGINVDMALFKPGQLTANLDICCEALLNDTSCRSCISTFYA